MDACVYLDISINLWYIITNVRRLLMGKMKDYWFSEIENTLHDLSTGAIDSTVCYERLRNLGLSEEDIPNWMDIDYANS